MTDRRIDVRRQEIVEVSGQLPIIAAIQRMFTDRGWSALAESALNFSVEKEGRVFSCFLYPSDKVVAMRGASQRLSEVAREPYCLVLTMEKDHRTGDPIYVPVSSIEGLPSGVSARLLEELAPPDS